MFWLSVKTDGHLDSVEEFLGIIAGKFKAISFFRSRIVVDDGVGQPSGGTHHRDRPIFQAINLIEAAGLIFRWHEEEIRPRFNFVSQPVIIGDPDPRFLRVFASDLGKEIVILLLSCSQKNESDVEREKFL